VDVAVGYSFFILTCLVYLGVYWVGSAVILRGRYFALLCELVAGLVGWLCCWFCCWFGLACLGCWCVVFVGMGVFVHAFALSGGVGWVLLGFV